MITKNDCLSLLVKLEDTGVPDAKLYIKKLVLLREPSIEILKFIVDNKGIDAIDFYEMLRKNHNKKKSPLYLNIVREDATLPDLITTLSCLLVQITLFGNKLANPTTFFREIRAEEITRVLNTYFKTGDATECIAMLRIIKADLLVLEYLSGRRALNS